MSTQQTPKERSQTTATAVLADGDVEGTENRTIHGVAISDNEVTNGLHGKKKWLPEDLERAAPTLKGHTVTAAPNVGGLEIDGALQTTNHGERAPVGTITDSAYEPGVGVVYEMDVRNEDIYSALALGELEVSIEASNPEEVEEDAETGALIMRGYRFDGMDVVEQGAARSNHAAAGPASQNKAIAALSAEDVGDMLDQRAEEQADQEEEEQEVDNQDQEESTQAEEAEEQEETEEPVEDEEAEDEDEAVADDAASDGDDQDAAADGPEGDDPEMESTSGPESTETDADADADTEAEEEVDEGNTDAGPADADADTESTDGGGEEVEGDTDDRDRDSSESTSDDDETDAETAANAAADEDADDSNMSETTTADEEQSTETQNETADTSDVETETQAQDLNLDGQVVIDEQRHDELKQKAALAEEYDEERSELKREVKTLNEQIGVVNEVYNAALADAGPHTEEFYEDTPLETKQKELANIHGVSDQEDADAAALSESVNKEQPLPQTGDQSPDDVEQTEAALEEQEETAKAALRLDDTTTVASSDQSAREFIQSTYGEDPADYDDDIELRDAIYSSGGDA